MRYKRGEGRTRFAPARWAQIVGCATHTAAGEGDATQRGDNGKGGKAVYIPLPYRLFAAVRLPLRLPFWVGRGANGGRNARSAGAQLLRS